MAAKKEKKVEAAVPEAKAEKKPSFAKPMEHDFSVIDCPVITEKTMALMQNGSKVTVKVAAWANKVEIKAAFQRIFQVKVINFNIVNQIAKTTTRGGRYKGTISGYKKAIVTLAEGNAIDLFKE